MKRCLVILSLILLVVPISAQTLSSHDTEVLQKIAKASADVKLLACDFKQVREVSIINDPEVSTGQMEYRSEGKILWKYLTPSAFQIAITQDEMVITRGTERRAIDLGSDPILNQVKELLLSILRGEQLTGAGRFQVSLTETPSETTVKLVPIPRQLKKLFSEIEITFKSKDYRVSAFQMKEQDGSTTKITFTTRKVE